MEKLFRQLFSDHCALWFYANSDFSNEKHVACIRSFAAKHSLKYDRYLNALSLSERVVRIFGVLLWPITTLVRAAIVTYRLKKALTDSTGWGGARHYFFCIWVAYRHNITPKAYYKFRLFLPENKRRIRLYLQDHEVAMVVRRLTNVLPQDGVETINDKWRFFNFFAAHGVPVAPVILCCVDGAEIVWLGSTATLDCDVVLKVTHLAGGEGVEVFSHMNGVWAQEGVALSRQGLLSYVRQKSRGATVLLQPRLENHAHIKPLAGNGLSTVRVMSVMVASNDPVLVSASMRMPTGLARVDSFGSGGLAAPVDVPSGQVLGPAVKKEIESAWVATHPNSGAVIGGWQLPCWPEVHALVRRAHSLLPDIPVIGWDVAILEDGPVLVEGNMGWGCELIQLLGHLPLGELPIAEILATRAVA